MMAALSETDLHQVSLGSHHRSMDTPPETLNHAAVELRRWQLADAELCFRLVTESLEHLRPWMPWATAGYSVADAQDYVRRCETEWAARTAFNYLITADGSPAGSASLMARIGDGGLEIGYWVHPAFTGRGLATSATSALSEAALNLDGIDHVEIHHDALNLASGRIPAKLGYSPAGTTTARFDLAPADSGTTKIWRLTR
jgi:ribosomal-protein-serine acetyltransferase